MSKPTLIESLAEFSDQLDHITEMAVGYRAKLEAAGYSPTMAEQLAGQPRQHARIGVRVDQAEVVEVSEFADLAAVAGGDETEVSVAEIRADVTAAYRRLYEAHPFFNPNNTGENQQ